MIFHEFCSRSDEVLKRKFREPKLIDFHKLLLLHGKFTELSNHGRQMMGHFRSTYTSEQFILKVNIVNKPYWRRLDVYRLEMSSCCNY
jgi:hypothetical protein